MRLDNVTLSVIVGLTLICIYILIVRKLPDTSKVIYLFIFAQSLTYGSFLILYGITEDVNYLIDNRWTIALGGLALLWVGLEGFIGELQKARRKQGTNEVLLKDWWGDRRKENIEYDDNRIQSQKMNEEEQITDMN